MNENTQLNYTLLDDEKLKQFYCFSFSRTVTKGRSYVQFSLNSHKLDKEDLVYAIDIVEQFKQRLEYFLNGCDEWYRESLGLGNIKKTQIRAILPVCITEYVTLRTLKVT